MFEELEPVIVVEGAASNAEQACQVMFYGDYHYCGEAGMGFVQCCLGGLN